jgi:hypothetical protein
MESVSQTSGACRPIPSLRWWISGILFASTAVNYVDRQTLSLLAPYLKHDFHWTNTDYANIVVAFRIAGEDLRQDLDGHVAAELRVPRTIHLSHPACAERRNDFIRPEL